MVSRRGRNHKPEKMMALLASSLFCLLLVLAFATHLFSLPSNWLLLLIIAGWAAWQPEAHVSLARWIFLLGLAAAAEVMEFLGQYWSAGKYGASKAGNWGSLAGAIIGAFLGIPFFFGLGALPGALAGAYGGCLLVELWRKRPLYEAKKAATGALLGKIWGFAGKIAAGAVILYQGIQLA